MSIQFIRTEEVGKCKLNCNQILIIVKLLASFLRTTLTTSYYKRNRTELSTNCINLNRVWEKKLQNWQRWTIYIVKLFQIKQKTAKLTPKFLKVERELQWISLLGDIILRSADRGTRTNWKIPLSLWADQMLARFPNLGRKKIPM